MTRLQELIVFLLIAREKFGRATSGNELWWWKSDVEPLVELGMIELKQLNAIPSLQNRISPSTIIRLTERGGHYFDR
jgi:hypothetical protein